MNAKDAKSAKWIHNPTSNPSRPAQRALAATQPRCVATQRAFAAAQPRFAVIQCALAAPQPRFAVNQPVLAEATPGVATFAYYKKTCGPDPVLVASSCDVPLTRCL